MSLRNTSTGKVLEQMILPALKHGGYEVSLQEKISKRIGDGNYFIDVLAKDEKRKKYLISLKWQQVGGTAEQKVPFEVISLIYILRKSRGKYKKAYLILGGEGWTLKKFFTNKGLNKYIKNANLVKILTLESFIAKANKGKL